jgi:ribosomal-protein-alanine N-acetyltransferase
MDLPVPVLRTARLALRAWTDADLEPFAALNADPQVMEFFPAPLARDESDRAAERIRAHFARHGFGLWAVGVVGEHPFIGFVGLGVPSFEAPFMPCVEIGWRLAHAHWGQGYALEAARAALDFAFGPLGLDEIVSFTSATNLRSQRVMERLGMRRAPGEDFDHPRIPRESPLARHVLYRVRR